MIRSHRMQYRVICLRTEPNGLGEARNRHGQLKLREQRDSALRAGSLHAISRF